MITNNLQTSELRKPLMVNDLRTRLYAKKTRGKPRVLSSIYTDLFEMVEVLGVEPKSCVATIESDAPP